VYPAPHGRVIRLQATLSEQLFHVPQRERVAQIPAHGTQNQLRLGLPPVEDLRSGCRIHDLCGLTADSANVATIPVNGCAGFSTGHACFGAVQSRAAAVLSASPRERQAGQGGAGRRNAQAAPHPQCDGQNANCLEAAMSRRLSTQGCPQVHKRDLSRSPMACGPCGQPSRLTDNTVAPVPEVECASQNVT
jgi:hypothetical protein